jgi:hypothetical protein
MTLRQQMPRRHVLIAGASSGTGEAPTRLPRPPLYCSDVYLSIARAPVSLLLERPSLYCSSARPSIARAPVPGAAVAGRLPSRGRALEHEGSAAVGPGTDLGA